MSPTFYSGSIVESHIQIPVESRRHCSIICNVEMIKNKKIESKTEKMIERKIESKTKDRRI